MYHIKVNGDQIFELEKSDDALLVNGEPVNADVKQISGNTWHVIDNLKSYNVELVNLNVGNKTAEIKVNNNNYRVEAKDQFDMLLDKLGMNNSIMARVSEVKAPMPGMVLNVFVNEGKEVKKGENLFTLEAMKMENIIKAPADVTVKSIKIKAGDKVEKGQVLMMF